MRSIILEAPNGGGKSTLADRLSIDLDMDVVHTGPRPKGSKEAISACKVQLRNIDNGMILDRVTPISRLVYQWGMSQNESMKLTRFLNEMVDNATIIYCTADGPFTNKEYYPEGHYEEIVAERDNIRCRYDMLMSVLPHIKYDWRSDSYEELLKEVYK